MKTAAWTIVVMICLSLAAHAGTIVYSYDEQHRLAGVNYDNQATATYEYDKASNLTGFTVLTESQYFKPFLLYFTKLRDALRDLFSREDLHCRISIGRARDMLQSSHHRMISGKGMTQVAVPTTRPMMSTETGISSITSMTAGMDLTSINMVPTTRIIHGPLAQEAIGNQSPDLRARI